ncbi:MAG: pyruvate kinase, partial [Planctomycetes bacterium]|nr:pyruvate kinase [Planctomycetota bacterium]
FHARSPPMTTRFICTIGPKTIDKEWLVKLHAAGMNIARVNGAHGTLDNVRDFIERLKCDLPQGVEILLDLPGNKIRTDGFLEPVILEAGQEFIIRPDMLTYRPLYKSLRTGHLISAADGTIKLEVTAVTGEDIKTKVLIGGPLANRKGVNIRGIHGEIPFDFERDIDLLNLAIEAKIDYVGLSFVRSVEHVRRITAQLIGTGVKVVAKVETAEAVKSVDDILNDADMIMIDRGDLEAEIGKEHVPLTQKAVIRRAKELGVPVIIASQFLTSMLTKPLPFMAEVSDIANAVLDGASVLMLSEETAIGDYPVECIETMKTVADTVSSQLERDHDVVILAAGPSTGFGSLTTNKHKCMLDVGGSTIIAHQLENLTLAGIPSKRISVVTGHNHQQIEHYLPSEDFEGEFVFNPWYQTSNMATSLWLTRKSEGNLIIVYGDIIFDPSILEDLLAAEGDIVLAVDRRPDLDAEDEKVIIEGDRILKSSKDIDLEDASGEFIGLAKLSHRGSRELFEELSRAVRDGKMMLFLSQVFERLAKRGVTITPCYTEGRAWSDNDNLADLGRSRESVYPRIREARSAHRPQESERR